MRILFDMSKLYGSYRNSVSNDHIFAIGKTCLSRKKVIDGSNSSLVFREDQFLLHSCVIYIINQSGRLTENIIKKAY